MANYKISESVSGEETTIIAKTPVEALILYLQAETVNPRGKSWNWDFEVEEVRSNV